MAKIASTLILVGVIISVQGHPATYEEILQAARETQLAQIQELSTSESDSSEDALRANFANHAGWKPASFNSVRDLKPADGGHVYGEAEYSFHSASNIDGKTTEDQAGHKIINDDGKVKEFDFTPTTEFLIHPIINPSHNQGNNDYSAADYSFHYAPSESEPADFIGVKKDANNNAKIQPAHNTPSTIQEHLPLQTMIIDQDPAPEPSGDEEDFVQPVNETEEAQAPEISNNDEKDTEIETVSPKTTLQTTEAATYTKPVQVDDDLEYVYESEPMINDDASANIDAQKFYISNETNLNNRTRTKRSILLRAYVGVMGPKSAPAYNVYSDGEYIIEPTENIKSKKIINNDEKVAKFEITTSTKMSLIARQAPVARNPTPLGSDNIYNANLDYNIESAPANSDEPAEDSHAPKINNNNQNGKKMYTTRNTESPFHFSPAVRKPKVKSDEDFVLFVASNIEGIDKINHKNDQKYGRAKVDVTRSFKKTTRPPRAFAAVMTLKPRHGGHEFGESQYSYSHSASYINHEPVVHHGIHPITPKSIHSPLSITDVRKLRPPLGGHVHGEAQYSYHTASNINGKVSEDKGGHKIINNNGQVKEFDFTPSPDLAPVSFI